MHFHISIDLKIESFVWMETCANLLFQIWLFLSWYNLALGVENIIKLNWDFVPIIDFKNVLVLFYTLSKSNEKLSLNLGVVCVWFVNIEYYNRISKRLLKQWGWRIKCSMRGKVVKIIKQRGFTLQWQWLGKAYLIFLLFSQVLLEMSILWMFVVFIWHPTRGSMRTRENKMQIIRNFGCTNCLSCLFSAKYKQNWHFKLEKCWNAKFLVHPTQEPGELILWPSVTAE